MLSVKVNLISKSRWCYSWFAAKASTISLIHFPVTHKCAIVACAIRDSSNNLRIMFACSMVIGWRLALMLCTQFFRYNCG